MVWSSDGCGVFVLWVASLFVLTCMRLLIRAVVVSRRVLVFVVFASGIGLVLLRDLYLPVNGNGDRIALQGRIMAC